jgi:hypothetical protein
MPATPTAAASAPESLPAAAPAPAPIVAAAPKSAPQPAAPVAAKTEKGTSATPAVPPIVASAPKPAPTPTSAPIITFVPKAGPPPAARVVAQPEPAAPPPSRPASTPRRTHDDADLVNYWNDLRGASRMPALAMLDRERIAGSWPDSLMVSYAEADAAMPKVARLSKPTGKIEYTPMVTDWIISCARHVAHNGEAMEDVQEFPISGGIARYHLVLLPFVTVQDSSKHVVCHLSSMLQERAGYA